MLLSAYATQQKWPRASGLSESDMVTNLTDLRAGGGLSDASIASLHAALAAKYPHKEFVIEEQSGDLPAYVALVDDDWLIGDPNLGVGMTEQVDPMAEYGIEKADADAMAEFHNRMLEVLG